MIIVANETFLEFLELQGAAHWEFNDEWFQLFGSAFDVMESLSRQGCAPKKGSFAQILHESIRVEGEQELQRLPSFYTGLDKEVEPLYAMDVSGELRNAMLPNSTKPFDLDDVWQVYLCCSYLLIPLICDLVLSQWFRQNKVSAKSRKFAEKVCNDLVDIFQQIGITSIFDPKTLREPQLAIAKLSGYVLKGDEESKHQIPTKRELEYKQNLEVTERLEKEYGWKLKSSELNEFIAQKLGVDPRTVQRYRKEIKDRSKS